LCFVEKARSKPLKLFKAQYSNAQLEATELDRAETLWICSIQLKTFHKEIVYLKRHAHCTKSPYIDQFHLFLDDQQLLRCKGRINNSLSAAVKNTVLLPSKHPFIKLLVIYMHCKIKHSGINDTLTALCERYWILRGRQVIKGILRSCVICKKLEGLPYCSQPFPDMPACRVSDDPPFTHMGLDFAGPLYIKDSKEGGNSTKTYICLFTCASTRAIHLELTHGLNKC